MIDTSINQNGKDVKVGSFPMHDEPADLGGGTYEWTIKLAILCVPYLFAFLVDHLCISVSSDRL